MTGEDPVRLSAGGSADARALLRSAAADEPSPAQLERLAARLPPAMPGAPASAGLGAKAWLALALAGGAAAIAVVAFTRPASSPASSSPPALAAMTPAASAELARAPSVPVPLAPPSPPAAVIEPPAVAAAPPAVAPARPSVRRSPSVSAPPPLSPTPSASPPPSPSPTASPSPSPPAPPRELDLLDPAWSALRARDPARALALASEHARLHPDGTMVAEREAIAIEALAALGRADDARARLARLLARDPGSAYRPRLERLLADPADPR